MKLGGLWTALVTPFKDDRLDKQGVETLVRSQIEAGVDAILLAGSTGEGATLTEDEREDLIRTAVSVGKGKILIWVATGASSTQLTIQRTLIAKSLGADGALIVSPVYNKPTQRGVYEHFKEIAAACKLPIVIYNHPGRTGVNILPLTMVELAKLPYIVGCKDNSSNLEQVSDYIHLLPKEFAILSGDETLAVPMMVVGAAGLIGPLSNLLPVPVLQMVRACERGDWNEARRIHFELWPLFKAMAFETNPIPIKAAMNYCGLPAGNMRLPLTELSQPHQDVLVQLLNDSGYILAQLRR